MNHLQLFEYGIQYNDESLHTTLPIKSAGICSCEIANIFPSSSSTFTLQVPLQLKSSKSSIFPTSSIGGNGLLYLYTNETSINTHNIHNQNVGFFNNFIFSPYFYKPINELDNYNQVVSDKEIQSLFHNIGILFSYTVKGRVVYKDFGSEEYE